MTTSFIIFTVVFLLALYMFFNSEIHFSWERRNPDGIDYTKTVFKKPSGSLRFTKEHYYVTEDEHELKENE